MEVAGSGWDGGGPEARATCALRSRGEAGFRGEAAGGWRSARRRSRRDCGACVSSTRIQPRTCAEASGSSRTAPTGRWSREVGGGSVGQLESPGAGHSARQELRCTPDGGSWVRAAGSGYWRAGRARRCARRRRGRARSRRGTRTTRRPLARSAAAAAPAGGRRNLLDFAAARGGRRRPRQASEMGRRSGLSSIRQPVSSNVKPAAAPAPRGRPGSRASEPAADARASRRTAP